MAEPTDYEQTSPPKSPDADVDNCKTTPKEEVPPSVESDAAVAEGEDEDYEGPGSDGLRIRGDVVYHVMKEMKDMSTRIQAIEYEINRVQKRDDSSSSSDDESDDAMEDENERELGNEARVRDCNWEQFKNAYSPEKSPFRYAIETLVATDTDDLEEQMEEEQMRRAPPEKRARIDYDRRREQPKPPRRSQREDDAPEMLRIERVRINSSIILGFLATVSGEKSLLEPKPHTFLRPFKLFIHFHDKAKEEFKALEERYNNSRPKDDDTAELASSSHEEEKATTVTSADTETGTEADQGQSPRSTTPVKDQKKDRVEEDPLEERYQHVKCYMTFVEERLLPTYHMFDKLDHADRPKVRYADLWSLFRSGDLVFRKEDSDDSDSTNVNNMESHRSGLRPGPGPRLFRVHFMTSETIDWVVEQRVNSSQDLRRASANKPGSVRVFTYSLDFNGESYSGIDKPFTISRFDGERDITKLEVYPIRFNPDAGQIIAGLKERGERFQKMLIHRHLAMEHDGWTLPEPVLAPSKSSSNSKDPPEPPVKKASEYISSDVIIDFAQAFQIHPNWKPTFQKYTTTAGLIDKRYDYFLIMLWSDSMRTRLLDQITEVVVQHDEVPEREWAKFSTEDDFVVDQSLRAFDKGDAKKKLTPEDQALLPRRLFVYSLRDRKWVLATIESLKEIPLMTDPFNDLKIPSHHKNLIRSTVQDHFRKKAIQRQLRLQGADTLEQDFIRSKGKGLVFLLHGAPGVGKTATAESVAYAHRKPLFPITCGDLGTDPHSVESNLTEIFRLANLWDCVLLLDEADIFLSNREKRDDNLQRNALVSIFLRTMEYYPGILFLTTNRVGALDEALSSRVHISINFPNLDYDQTLALFRMNLKRSEKIAEQRATFPGEPKLIIDREEIEEFARDQFHKSDPDPWWNGRVIRNAFQVAMSLAYVSSGDYTDGPVVSTTTSHGGSGGNSDETLAPTPTRRFGRDHFEQVLKIFDDFKLYRHALFSKTDGELAAAREERYAESKPSARDHLGGGRDAGSRGNSSRDFRRSNPGTPSHYGFSPREGMNTAPPPRGRGDQEYGREFGTPPHHSDAGQGATGTHLGHTPSIPAGGPPGSPSFRSAEPRDFGESQYRYR